MSNFRILHFSGNIRVGRLKKDSVTIEYTLDLMINYVKFQNFVQPVQGFPVPYIHEECF